MANRYSNFPYSVDVLKQIPEFYELQENDKKKTIRYKELIGKVILNEDEKKELNNLFIELRDKMILADDWNKLANAVITCQDYFKNKVLLDISDMVNKKEIELEGKQNEVINIVNKSKDDALTSIEKKKENIITYMDSTTTGKMRNDIGVMGDSTVEGNSLVEKTNKISNKITLLNGQGEIKEKLNKNDFETYKQSTALSLSNKISKKEILKNPLEIGSWIDFHKPDSTKDYDARLFIDDECTLYHSSPESGNNKILDYRDYIKLYQYAYSGKCRDARAEGSKSPKWYIDNGFHDQTILELNVLKNIGVNGEGGNVMCHIYTSIPWGDTTGGVTQIIRGVKFGEIYERHAIDKDTWSPISGMLSSNGGQMTGMLTAQSNTSYTTRQVRNIILSPNKADINQMQNGDVWFQYGIKG